MAAEVTVASGYPRINIIGSMRQFLYKVTAASTTDYLTTPLRAVKSVTVTGSASATAPGCTVASVSASNPKKRVTLALGATDSALFIAVEGW
jgi:hypothetical protein